MNDYDVIAIRGGAPGATAPVRWPRAAWALRSSSASSPAPPQMLRSRLGPSFPARSRGRERRTRARRADGRRDRRQLRHRAGDRQASTRRGRRHRPHRPQPGTASARRTRARRREQRGVRRHRLRAPRAVLRRAADPGRPRHGHRPAARTTRGWPTSTSTRRAATSTSIFWLPLHIARRAVGKVRAGGTLLFIGGTGGRRPASGSRSSRRSLPRCRRSRGARARARADPRQPYRAPASSTRRCRHHCSATSWTRAASSSARRCRSGAWSARPTSPRSPSTS